MRASSSGRKDLSKGWVTGELAFAGWRFLDEPLDDGVGGESFADGGEVGDDAMSEDGSGKFLDVFDIGGGASVEECAGFGTEEQVLDGAGAGTPGE
jgi:hypothetical protein